MKKNLRILTALLAVSTMVAASGIAMAAENPFGSTGAAGDDSYTLEEMLTYAVQDEYMAQAEYNAIISAYGSQRPFSNIVRAEATHIDLLLPLFKTYGFTVPENNAESKAILPSSLTESYKAGVSAEVKNIAMYESFLKEELSTDVEAVFEHLQAASENHLKAFENAASGTRGSGMGRGNAQGNGQSGNVSRGSGSGQGGMNRGMNNGTGMGSGSGNGNADVCILN